MNYIFLTNMWRDYFSFNFGRVFHQTELDLSDLDQNWAKSGPLLLPTFEISISMDSSIVHWLHLFGFSPMCVSNVSTNFSDFRRYEITLIAFLWPFSNMVSKCNLTPPLRENIYSHWLHLCALMPFKGTVAYILKSCWRLFKHCHCANYTVLSGGCLRLRQILVCQLFLEGEKRYWMIETCVTEASWTSRATNSR